jgi:hypothetical protein
MNKRQLVCLTDSVGEASRYIIILASFNIPHFSYSVKYRQNFLNYNHKF